MSHTHTRLLAFTVFVVLAAACSSQESEVVASEGDLGHIHDLVLDDDGTLLAATHTGLYRIDDLDRALLVGSGRHDLMSMTISDQDLLASGHPDLRDPTYAVEGKPPFLGLARSSDYGKTWEVESLLGDADFHALVAHPDGLFAAETTGQIWFLDSEGSEWVQLGGVEARDLAIDPDDSDRQLASGYDGQVWMSADRAASWAPSLLAPQLVEIEWPEPELVIGVDESGSIWTTDDPEGPWTESAVGPMEVETFFVDPTGRWWISVHGGAIVRSDDLGQNWVDIYVPPSQE